MTADQARVRVRRLMMLARGTVLQGRLWALLELCRGDGAFLAAIRLVPQRVNQALKRALGLGRNRITLSDIQFVRKSEAECQQGNYLQYRLF